MSIRNGGIFMKKKDRYIFPAVFTYEEGQSIAVDFPDLECATCGVDDVDALNAARELLGCVICGLEEDGDDIPQPTPLVNVKLEPNERACLIDVFMPVYRLTRVNKSVNRTVTLPAWLNAEAMEHKINFSQVLQEALKVQLGHK